MTKRFKDIANQLTGNKLICSECSSKIFPADIDGINFFNSKLNFYYCKECDTICIVNSKDIEETKIDILTDLKDQ